MNYIECIGLPGSGKSTYLSENYKNHINEYDFLKFYKFFFIIKFLFMIFRIYGVNNINRIYFSYLHIFQILTSKSNLVLDQGLIQIYLSHCSDENKKVSLSLLKKMIFFINKNFIIIDFEIFNELSFEVINSRLKSRNKNRSNGISESFYDYFLINQTIFKKLVK